MKEERGRREFVKLASRPRVPHVGSPGPRLWHGPCHRLHSGGHYEGSAWDTGQVYPRLHHPHRGAGRMALNLPRKGSWTSSSLQRVFEWGLRMG